jgi:hypothetical protein
MREELQGMTLFQLLATWVTGRWHRPPRPGDRWTDGSGRVHVLAVRDDDGNMTTGDVRL